MEILGIDIGGSGVKAALVDIDKGELLSDKIRFQTPENGSPKKIFDGSKEKDPNFINPGDTVIFKNITKDQYKNFNE